MPSHKDEAPGFPLGPGQGPGRRTLPGLSGSLSLRHRGRMSD